MSTRGHGRCGLANDASGLRLQAMLYAVKVIVEGAILFDQMMPPPPYAQVGFLAGNLKNPLSPPSHLMLPMFEQF
jgi:hypothetical protein